MSWLMDLADRLRAAFRTRRMVKAQADLQRGADILAQAQKEADEMAAAVAAQEARKRLDAELSGVPIVPVEPPKP